MQYIEHKGAVFTVNGEAVTTTATATDGTEITVAGTVPRGVNNPDALDDLMEALHQQLLFRIQELGGDYELTNEGTPVRAREHRGGVIIYWRGVTNPQRYRGCYCLDITGGKFECITATPRVDGYASIDDLAAALEHEALAKLHQR